MHFIILHFYIKYPSFILNPHQKITMWKKKKPLAWKTVHQKYKW